MDKPEKAKIKHIKCHRFVHMIKNCHLDTKSQRADKSSKDTDDINLYIESDTYARDKALRTNKEWNNDTCWIVSECTLHMCNDVDTFKDINSYEREKLKLANNLCENWSKKNNTIPRERKWNWKNDAFSRYVPHLHTNLIFVNWITDKRYNVIFDKDQAAVIDEAGNKVLVAER